MDLEMDVDDENSWEEEMDEFLGDDFVWYWEETVDQMINPWRYEKRKPFYIPPSKRDEYFEQNNYFGLRREDG